MSVLGEMEMGGILEGATLVVAAGGPEGATICLGFALGGPGIALTGNDPLSGAKEQGKVAVVGMGGAAMDAFALPSNWATTFAT